MGNHEKLLVYQKGIDFVAAVYEATKSFPRDEIFGLTSQLRRAAVSIPANIAEGQGRLTDGEFRQFLGHARGSTLEAETHVRISVRLGYLSAAAAKPLLEATAELGRLINGFIGALR